MTFKLQTHSAISSRERMQSRLLDIVTAVSVGLSLIVLALMLEPVRKGDEHYYFAILEGLATSVSPAITLAVSEVVLTHLNLAVSKGMVIVATDGRVYAWHFLPFHYFAYPAYKLLQMLGMDVFKAFQLKPAIPIYG